MMIEKVDFFRSLLIYRLHKLQSAAGKTYNEMKMDETRHSDPVDQSVKERDRSVLLSIKNREQILIREIQDALVRIDWGEFGVCQSCGEQISEKRLKVKPTCRLCISCKAKEEHHEKYAIYFSEMTFEECNDLR